MIYSSEQLPATVVALKKTRPIIKWTGGKYDEYAEFSRFIPSFKNYYEPFFGGGGVFFAARPQGKAFLNDKSKDLFAFYSLIHSSLLKKHLLKYADAWDEAKVLTMACTSKLLPIFVKFIKGAYQLEQLQSQVKFIVEDEISNKHYSLLDESFIIDSNAFKTKLAHSIADKIKRIAAISIKEQRHFTKSELSEHIETGIKSGLYLYLRKITNQHATGALSLPKEKAVANWYFVREFCYASMFRFNAKGEFNIPYGGIAYNKKDFRQKVNNIFSPTIKELFKNASFYNHDFEEFLRKTKPHKGDFIFVDPPYDSEFSEYDQNAFTKEDQERLRDVLVKMPAKMMMVIKETPFIRNLYSGHCRLIEFDKTYTYNVRGRNNRDTKHLIIINYDIGEHALHLPK
ncbi:DNA adenine methylase [Aridibaculum aurantiacum]|uniref:DNA adenine methylase n=1 Tax=Aridibaculum aurantiacum TaxID=2810307 RepID=UPI001A9682DB|nr:DNA adenine methylase [Aridibaculum aurantiacum]